MASRAILRRRKFFSDYLNVSARPLVTFQSSGFGQSTQDLDSRSFSSFANHISQVSDSSKDGDGNKVVTNELLRLTTSPGLVWHRCNGISLAGYTNGRLDLFSPTGARSMSQLRYSSTATLKQPDFGSDDEGNDEVAKKRKEASPEECDQAVVGLSTAKAKAKAKRLQESHKVAKSALQRVWSVLLGIGPALRAVASMSRLEFTSYLVDLHMWEIKLGIILFSFLI